MTTSINIGNESFRITAEPLTQAAFEPFGDVVGNPRPTVHPSAFDAQADSLPPNAVSANQGSAIRYENVSRIQNLYSRAPSRVGNPIMSVFSCAARELEPAGPGMRGEFTVKVLERHPFTTQTFGPLASSASEYLVIVAPSLPPSDLDKDLPVPDGDSLPGRGLPDIRRLRAFVASNSQAVTYGAGTWHAPMAVFGRQGTCLDFAVSQFSSGVGVEDCQLVDFESRGASKPRIKVRIPKLSKEKRIKGSRL